MEPTLTVTIRWLAGRAAAANEKMYPGYFAMVMATGIVSTALFFEKVKGLSAILFVVNMIAYVVLVVATLYRAVRFGAKLWADLTNSQTMFAFFTFVAASDVLGVQFFLRHQTIAALALWIVASACWLFLSYFCCGTLTFSNTRSLAEGVNASWLILIVGTQSITVLGSLLAPGFGRNSQAVLLILYGLWGVGIAFYGIFITLIICRLFFTKVDPGEMLPPYWIILGATAISALAGTNLTSVSLHAPFLTALNPMVQGVTLLLLAWSSWWIPMLVIYGLWRHLFCKKPLSYHPAYWSLVFPLGMYTVAIYRASVVMHLNVLNGISSVMVWVAFTTWCITLFGLVASTSRSIMHSPLVQRPILERKEA